MARRDRPTPPPKRVRDISLFLGRSTNLPDGRLAMIFIVLEALDGNKLAQELLDAAGYVMFDTNGKQIYPPLPKDREEDEEREEPPRNNVNNSGESE